MERRPGMRWNQQPTRVESTVDGDRRPFLLLEMRHHASEDHCPAAVLNSRLSVGS
jgi:hypothetical protein